MLLIVTCILLSKAFGIASLGNHNSKKPIGLGPVYMEVGGPQVGEVTCLGGVTHLNVIRKTVLGGI